MAVYRLEYAETRRFENGQWVLVPADKMVYTPLNFTTTDYEEAYQMRCELNSSMSQGYVRIVKDCV